MSRFALASALRWACGFPSVSVCRSVLTLGLVFAWLSLSTWQCGLPLGSAWRSVFAWRSR